MTQSEKPQPIDSSSIVSLEGDVLRLTVEDARPQGYRMEFSLDLPPSHQPVNIQGKVIAAVRSKEEDSKTTISLRVHSLRRSDRERIQAHIGRAQHSNAASLISEG